MGVELNQKRVWLWIILCLLNRSGSVDWLVCGLVSLSRTFVGDYILWVILDLYKKLIIFENF